MAEKILLLLVVFLSGAVTAWFAMGKLLSVALRHSPQLRAYMSNALRRYDTVASDPIMQEAVGAGMREARLSSERYKFVTVAPQTADDLTENELIELSVVAPNLVCIIEHEPPREVEGTRRLARHELAALMRMRARFHPCAFGRSIPWTELCKLEGNSRFRDRFGIHDVCAEHARILEEKDAEEPQEKSE